jgi:hypothetical protein
VLIAALVTPLKEPQFSFQPVRPRCAAMMAFDATHDGREKVKVFSQTSLAIGSTDLDLTSVAQLVSKSQTRAIADVILYAKRHAREGVSLSALLDLIEVRGISSFPMHQPPCPFPNLFILVSTTLPTFPTWLRTFVGSRAPTKNSCTT